MRKKTAIVIAIELNVIVKQQEVIMSKILTAIPCLTVAIFVLCSCASKPQYNTGSHDNYRLGDALLEAIAKGENKAAKELVIKGAPLNFKDKKDEWTPLVYAIYYRNSDMSAFLIKAGADPNLKDHSNRTALMWAAMRGDLTTLRLLIEHNADLNAVDIVGRNALNYATSYDNSAAAFYLARIGKIETPPPVTPKEKTPVPTLNAPKTVVPAVTTPKAVVPAVAAPKTKMPSAAIATVKPVTPAVTPVAKPKVPAAKTANTVITDTKKVLPPVPTIKK